MSGFNEIRQFIAGKYCLPTFLVLYTSLLFSCRKEEYVGKNPYEGAMAPLEIKLNSTVASPGEGTAGAIVTVTGRGFERYRDSGMAVKFNGVAGQITEVGDTVLKVKVPELASSGLITLTVLHQVFPGPYFQVKGPLYIDPSFRAVPGANDAISCIGFIPGGKYLIGGAFNDYDNSGIATGFPGLARINGDGSIDRSFAIGKGIQGAAAALAVQADGKYVIGGNFSNFNERFKAGAVGNIIRLNADGSPDSVIVDTQAGNRDTVPALNAYFNGTVSHILQTPDSGKLVIIGQFSLYMRKDFTIASADGLRDSLKVDSIRMEGIARLNEDGSFDSAFNYDPVTHSGYAGTNGQIYDAVMQNDGKVVIAGNFTKYRGQQANKLARLNEDGSLDPSFSTGAGPDDRVFSVAVLQNGKYLIGGQFNHVDGKENRKVALLNQDGSPDNSFSTGTGPLAGSDGIVFKAAPLKNGKLLVTGSFDYFSGIKRKGTVVLNEDGSISSEYNNLGAMEHGTVNGILNVPNANATILIGTFTRYDLQPANRIVLLKY